MAEYEKEKQYPLGRLIAARELPVLKKAHELIANSTKTAPTEMKI